MPVPTVNPSLWRQAMLNLNNGLFKVTDGIYQVRGFDTASMMIVESASGIIILDPMTSVETSKAALELYREHRGNRVVKALLYTHSHIDHFGGVKGVISEEDAREGRVKVIAPNGFLDHAISENVFAGNAMGRRSYYQFGTFLARGPRGQVDGGIGKGVSTGQGSLIAPQPENIIANPLEVRTVDGIEMWFLLAPETEAPAEMMIWLPQFKALCAAEDMNHTNHNLLTLRGAWHKVVEDPILKFFVVAVTAYMMATFEGPMLAVKSVNALAHYTDWIIAHVHTGALGWNGFLTFGMIYWLLPRRRRRRRGSSTRAPPRRPQEAQEGSGTSGTFPGFPAIPRSWS